MIVRGVLVSDSPLAVVAFTITLTLCTRNIVTVRALCNRFQFLYLSTVRTAGTSFVYALEVKIHLYAVHAWQNIQ